MKIIQCRNQHYYDSEKYTCCPYCIEEKKEDNGISIGIEQKKILQEEEEKTISCLETEEDEAPTLAFYWKEMTENEKTIGQYQKPGQAEKVTGWLVCIEGEMKGASYRLGYGRNFIGRAPDMDICLSEDMMVSRLRHGAIVFDDKNCTFYITPWTGIIYLQGERLERPKILLEDMVLEIGRGKYQFVPYCNGRRGWE